MNPHANRIKENLTFVPMSISDLIIHKDHHLVAFNKTPGMPVQADKSNDMSLLQLGIMYTKSHLFLINRLDRPVSGIVLMGKHKDIVTQISNSDKVKKTYLAVVKKGIAEENAELTHYLQKDSKRKRAVVKTEPTEGFKESTLRYTLVKSMDNYDLLSIELVTGRFHQIRAQLAHIGHPIKGDVKYGARRKNSDRSIHLHAYQLEFVHPKSNQQIKLTAPIPVTDGLWKSVAEYLQ